jgi:hypothetical protein
MWVACAPVAYPLTNEDGTPSVAAADGAEPIANMAEKLATTDVIVSALRNTMDPFREPDDRLREGNRASKAALCLGASPRIHHDPPSSAGFHRCWPHVRGVVIRSSACG